MIGVGVSLFGRLVKAFNPVSLFADDEEGTFLDFTTTQVYADTAGTDPAEVGEGIALVLDKSQGGELGAELVTNGDFSDGATGWGAANVTISGGIADYADNTVGASQVTQSTLSTVSGKVYQIQFTANASSVGVFYVVVGGAFYAVNVVSGVNVFVLTAGATATDFRLRANTSNVYTGTIDNISVREVPGVHALQATSTARPIFGRVPVGGRRNLLERTEEFDNAYWGKLFVTVTAEAAIAPDGTTTANKIVETANNGSHIVSRNAYTVGAVNKLSFFAKSSGDGRFFQITGGGLSSLNEAPVFDVDLGVVVTPAGSTQFISALIEPVGNGWFRCSLTQTPSSTTAQLILSNSSSNNGVVSYTGDGTSGIYIWGAQMEVAA